MSTLIANTIQGVNTIKVDASTTAATIASNGEISGNYLIDNNYPIFACQGISGFQSAAYEGVGANVVCPSGYTTTHINQAGLMGNDGAMIIPTTGIYEWFVCTNSGTADGHRGLYVYRKSGGTTTAVDNVFSMNDYSGYTLISHRISALSQGDKILWGYHNSYVQWTTNVAYFNCWGRRIK